MATEIIGYTDREQRDAEYWRLKEKGVKGLNRYTTHSDLPEPGEVIPDKWKGWNTSIIYVLAVPVKTLPSVVAEAEEMIAAESPSTKVPLTEEEELAILMAMKDEDIDTSDIPESTPEQLAQMRLRHELDKQSTHPIPTRFRGLVELPKPGPVDSSKRPNASTDEDIF